MHIDEILKQYHNEWLLIEVEKFDENYRPIEGKVLVHSQVEQEVLNALATCKSKNVAIKYAGTIPKDVAVLL